MNIHPPGTLIRDLRLERQLSLESLAGDASLTSLALSNIELKGARPQRTTLLGLLDALEAVRPIPIARRQEALNAYGYLDHPPAPNDEDIRRAIEGWRRSFNDTPFPAYLVDFTQRIHDWNDRSLILMDATREELVGLTVFDLLFSSSGRWKVRLANGEEVASKTISQMRHEYEPFRGQPWCERCLADAFARYPAFKELYEAGAKDASEPIDIRVLEPVLLHDGAGGTLRFRIIGVDLVSDPRFRVVQYAPMDAYTLSAMAALQ